MRETQALLKRNREDFPGGTVDKNSLATAGGHRFERWSGKISYAVGQLSLCATTSESALWSLQATTPEPMRCNYLSPYALEPALRNKKPPQ